MKTAHFQKKMTRWAFGKVCIHPVFYISAVHITNVRHLNSTAGSAILRPPPAGTSTDDPLASATSVQKNYECQVCSPGTQHFEAGKPDGIFLSNWKPTEVDPASFGRDLPGRDTVAHDLPYAAPARAIDIMDGTMDDWYGIEAIGQTAFRPDVGISVRHGDQITCCGDNSTTVFVQSGASLSNDLGIWNGKDDFSGAFSVAWDKDALYIGIKITDDTHVCPGSSTATGCQMSWADDGECDVPSGCTSGDHEDCGTVEEIIGDFRCDHVQIHIAAAGSSPIALIDLDSLHKLSCFMLDDGTSHITRQDNAEGSACHATRAGHVTTYQVRLPAILFGVDEMTPFMRFAAALLYSDSDDDVPGQSEGWQTWSGWAPWAVAARQPESFLQGITAKSVAMGQVALMASRKSLDKASWGPETCIQCPPGRFDDDAADGVMSPASVCAICPPDSYQDATGSTACIACPRGRVSSKESVSLSNCTSTPEFRGCYIDRETLIDERDLSGSRTRMGQSASLAACVQFCTSGRYDFIGMQSTDQCFCDNSYGTYGRLDDEACGALGSTCGRASTESCVMRNAIFRIPARWTCANVSCSSGTASLPEVLDQVVPSDSDAAAQAVCCGSSCADWNGICASDTQLVTPVPAGNTAAGADPQATCCTPILCEPGTYRAFHDDKCHWCPAGKISAADGLAGECIGCSAGMYARPASSVACALCEAGQFDHDQDASTQCQSCSPGMFKSTDMPECSICPAGTESPAGSTSSDACAMCTAGRHDHDLDARTQCAGTAAAVGTDTLHFDSVCAVEWAAMTDSSKTALVAALAAGTQAKVGSPDLLAVMACLWQAKDNETNAWPTAARGCTDSLAINFNPMSIAPDGSCEYDCRSLATGDGGAASCLIFANDGAWHPAQNIEQMLSMAPSKSLVVQGKPSDSAGIFTMSLLGDDLQRWMPNEPMLTDQPMLGPDSPDDAYDAELSGLAPNLIQVASLFSRYPCLPPLVRLPPSPMKSFVTTFASQPELRLLSVSGL